MKPPKISIVIPSYNKVKYIRETLESIVNQNYPNLEVIIQDGGSTDGSMRIINEFKRKYPEIFEVESKKDKGQLDAINKGLKKATGDLLTYINADDTYEKNAFNNVSQIYEKNPEALWFAGRGRVVDDQGIEIVKLVTWYKQCLLSFNSLFFLLVTNYFMQPSVFLTREGLDVIGFIGGKTKFIMEYEIWLRLAKNSMPIIIPSVLSMFRIPEKSFSRNFIHTILIEDLRIVRKYTRNPIILLLHKLHNLGRIGIIRNI